MSTCIRNYLSVFNYDGEEDGYPVSQIITDFNPSFILMILILIKIALVWNENQRTYLSISLLYIIQYITLCIKYPNNSINDIKYYYLVPTMLIVLTIDVFYVHISTFRP